MLFLAIFFYSQLLSDNDSRDSIKPLFFFLCPFLCLFYHVGECITNLIGTEDVSYHLCRFFI